MADIRQITDEIDLSNPPGPEWPMRQGVRWGPVDSTWPENMLNSGPSFGAHHPSDNGTGVWWSNYRIGGPFYGDMEAWGTIIGGQFGAAGEGWRIGFWDPTSLGGGATARGYVGLVFHALGDAVIIRKYNLATYGSVNLTPTGGVGGGPPWNNKLLFRRRGAALELWTAASPYTNWTLMQSADDTEYIGQPMQFAFASEDPTHGGLGWQGVGGGQRTRTRIIRYPSN